MPRKYQRTKDIPDPGIVKGPKPVSPSTTPEIKMQNQIEISAEAATTVVDSLELAIEILEDTYHEYDPSTDANYVYQIRRSIEELQMIRVSYMILARKGGRISGNILSRKAFASTRCTCDANAANRAIGNHFGDCPLR
jgi:hypothetical protein